MPCLVLQPLIHLKGRRDFFFQLSKAINLGTHMKFRHPCRYHCVIICFQTGCSHVTRSSLICAIVTQINTRTEDPRGTKRPFSLHLPCFSDRSKLLVSKWFYIHRVLLFCIVYLSTSSLCNFSKVPDYCYFVLCIRFVF